MAISASFTRHSSRLLKHGSSTAAVAVAVADQQNNLSIKSPVTALAQPADPPNSPIIRGTHNSQTGDRILNLR